MADNKTKFAIIAIKELGFSYKNPFEIIKDFNFEKNPLEFKIGVNYRWNLENNLFAVVLDLVYLFIRKDNSTEELVKLSFATEFVVEKLQDIFTVRSVSDFEMDEKFESTFVGIAVSTGRGLFFEKTSGTVFSNYIIPIVNPMDLILSKKIKNAAVKT